MVLKNLFAYLFCFFVLGVQAQSYTLESIDQNKLRNKQLLGEYDSAVSFTVQTNSILGTPKADWAKPHFTLLPFVLTQQFNSHHPFGWNDGAMIQSQGYQVLARPGVNMHYGVLELQAAPEFVFAANGNYPTNAHYGDPNSKSFNKIFPGQSFAKLNLGPVSLGVSSENLWWGPGIYSSLLMSNNAPGFLHAFVKTNRPIKTPIGNLEFNLIGAKLESDHKQSYENYHLQILSINDKWRYLNSFAISWQPKWISGLFLGMTRSLQQYGDEAFNVNGGLLSKYLPALSLAFQKKNNLIDDSLHRDQVASFFLRWVFTKSNLEFYTEYGFNDYSNNIRDYLMSPSHSAAYTVGVRKIIRKTSVKYVQLEAELTQMSQSPDYLVRDALNWYQHWQVNQGYTHLNQIIGAGAGWGANVQTITATWFKGDIRNGVLLQRIEHDPVNYINKWTDFSIGWMPQWAINKFILAANIQFIYSNNYIWENGNNVINLHSRLMLQYNFK